MSAVRSKSKRNATPSASVLSAENSETVRDRLVKEISTLPSADDALAWALRRIGLKNSLKEEDAASVDAAFRDHIRAFAPEVPEGQPPSSRTETPNEDDGQSLLSTTTQLSPGQPQVRKLAKRGSGEPPAEYGRRVGLMKPTRARDKEHLRCIALQPCTICGRQPCEAHHIRYAQPRALGRRVSDEFTVPLCRLHHRELHQQGDERVWWNKFNVDPMPIALRFWLRTRRGITPGESDAGQSTPSNDTGSAEADGAMRSDGCPRLPVTDDATETAP